MLLVNQQQNCFLVVTKTQIMTVDNASKVIPTEIFLWHPFNKHGQESYEKIIERKTTEINLCGYTYWSFGMGAIQQSMIADQWRIPLRQNTDENGFAYVMLGLEKTKGTTKAGERATHFNESALFKKKNMGIHDLNLDATGWKIIPTGINATRHKIADQPSLALKVYDIIHVDEDSDLKVEWWNQKGQWVSERPQGIEQHAVKLLRKSEKGRPIKSSETRCDYLLKIKYPFIVSIQRIR